MKRFLFLFLAISAPLLGWQKKLKANIQSAHPPAWMIEQIQDDLKPFAKGIALTSIEEMLRLGIQDPTNHPFLHCKIINGKIEATTQFQDDPKVAELIKNLEILNSVVQFPSMEFLILLKENTGDLNLSGPVFASAKDASKPGNFILFPDFEALSGGSQQFMKEVKKGVKKYPWKQKLDQAVWRGVTAGGKYNLENFLSFPRSQLITRSLDLPELIDAKYSACWQIQDKNEILQQYSQYFSAPLSIAEHLRHKYQILVDGNSCTYSRAYWQLFSNCVIFKQTSNNIQWFYKALKPYVHYIPVEKNFSDLPEKIEWAKLNDTKCFKISKNAQSFAKKNLTRDQVFYYVYLLLNQYAKLWKS